MSIKLSALALGITLTYGATAALAAENASIYQQGWFNDATVEQFDTRSVTGTIVQEGSGNDGTILQKDVNNSLATVYQGGSDGSAVIKQGTTWGWGWSEGSNQVAHIVQGRGFGNDAWITQTGANLDGNIYQEGIRNSAGIEQHGTGGAHNEAAITQSGVRNDAYINQRGQGLTASVYQQGLGNEATVMQTGRDMVATVTQSQGFHNTAYISQR